ncbi:MAG: hypothetical protein AVDCRST_MAG90-2867, partial [uncultured Microvirga sp.]
CVGLSIHSWPPPCWRPFRARLRRRVSTCRSGRVASISMTTARVVARSSRSAVPVARWSRSASFAATGRPARCAARSSASGFAETASWSAARSRNAARCAAAAT